MKSLFEVSGLVRTDPGYSELPGLGICRCSTSLAGGTGARQAIPNVENGDQRRRRKPLRLTRAMSPMMENQSQDEHQQMASLEGVRLAVQAMRQEHP